MFPPNVSQKVEEDADILLFVSRSILISQELSESRNVTLEEVSNIVPKRG